MTVQALAMMPRLNQAARFAFVSTILCVSLLVSACGGGTSDTTGNSANSLSSLPAPGSSILTVSKAGSGSVTSAPGGINCGTSCSAAYAAGTAVTLTAAAASGYSFAGWSGACSGTSVSCTVSMTTARSVNASFSQNVVNYTLSVATSGSGSVTSSPGGINCGTSCSAAYAAGTAVTLTAAAASGYSFAGWSGACSGT
ncbi:MAG: InlB B-repeat-containing protein, partial [Sulfuricaulis sp.]